MSDHFTETDKELIKGAILDGANEGFKRATGIDVQKEIRKAKAAEKKAAKRAKDKK